MEISKRCAVLENLNDSEDINRACVNFEENSKTSAKGGLGPYELCDVKRHFGFKNASLIFLTDLGHGSPNCGPQPHLEFFYLIRKFHNNLGS
jgi:hypothetical protein